METYHASRIPNSEKTRELDDIQNRNLWTQLRIFKRQNHGNCSIPVNLLLILINVVKTFLITIRKSSPVQTSSSTNLQFEINLPCHRNPYQPNLYRNSQPFALSKANSKVFLFALFNSTQPDGILAAETAKLQTDSQHTKNNLKATSFSYQDFHESRKRTPNLFGIYDVFETVPFSKEHKTLGVSPLKVIEPKISYNYYLLLPQEISKFRTHRFYLIPLNPRKLSFFYTSNIIMTFSR